jgi:hypothetical protein
MTREQLEHIIRASAAIAGIEDIIVIGSQSVLGQFPNAPAELLVSREADVYPMEHPERGDLIDGSIGEGSPFERQFGYYAHGVDDSTAILPAGWRDRLVVVSNANTRETRGWCLEVHDLAIAKYVAGREKDVLFTKALAKHAMTRSDVLLQRLRNTKVNEVDRRRVEERITLDFAGV